MITIFSIPKPFEGHIGVIQRNAIESWKRISSDIILFGEGIEGVKSVPIKKNKFGTPILSSAFNMAKSMAKNNILMYTNADMVYTPDLLDAVKRIDKDIYLMSGRRLDVDNLTDKGKLHGFSGMDYFIFPIKTPLNLPEFAVGRIGWDSWLIFHAKTMKIPVIDATESITAIHQNHDYSHSSFSNEKKKRVEGPEMEENFRLAGGLSNMLTIREADWILARDKLKRPEFPRNIYSKLSTLRLWRETLALKRKIIN